MRVKFIGATEAEDRIVEIPDGTTEVQVEMPEQEAKPRSPWPAFSFLVVVMVWVLVIIWMFRG